MSLFLTLCCQYKHTISLPMPNEGSTSCHLFLPGWKEGISRAAVASSPQPCSQTLPLAAMAEKEGAQTWILEAWNSSTDVLPANMHP